MHEFYYFVLAAFIINGIAVFIMSKIFPPSGKKL